MIILCYAIRKDVDELYKRQTLRANGFHQSQILHADNKLQLYMIFIGSSLA